MTVVVTPLAPAAGRKGTPEKVKAPVTVSATKSTVIGNVVGTVTVTIFHDGWEGQ